MPFVTLEFQASVLPFLDISLTSIRYIRPSRIRHLREELLDIVGVDVIVYSSVCSLNRKGNRRFGFVFTEMR